MIELRRHLWLFTRRIPTTVLYETLEMIDEIDQKKEQQSWTRLRPEFKSCSFLSEDTRFGPILDPIEVHFGPAFFF